MTQDRKKLHICMIVPQSDVHGGIASVVNGYRNSDLEKRHRITYVESYCDGSKWKKLKKALTAYITFLRVLRKEKVDVIHIHSSFGPSFYRKMPFIFWGKRAGIPVINHIHGSALDDLYTNAGRWKKRLVEKNYQACDKLIVLSEYWRNEFSLIVPEEKICVLANAAAVHTETTAPAFRDNRFRSRKIAFLGVITREKGVYTFPKIMKRVSEEFPDAQLTVAGVGEIEQLKSVTDEKTAEHIDYPGWISGEQKEKLLRESALLLFPSHMESFGMSIIEAMGYGMPVVSCRTGSIPSIVREGENGFLLEVDDSEGMTEAVLRLFRDRQLWEKMSDRSLELTQENYSLESHLDRLSGLYEELAGASSLSQ